MLRTLISMALLASIQSAAVANGRDLMVPQRYPTIQSALDSAAPGATIVVAPGVYRENLVMRNPVTLQSARGYATTIIDGRGVGPVIVARGTGSESIAIAGFTIRNGRNLFTTAESEVPGSGGGIHVDSVNATISDNVITGNVSCLGSGISATTAQLQVRHNRISANIQDPSCNGSDGGGIFINGGGKRASVIASNEISANRIGGRGAGIAAQATTDLSIDSNLITNNVAGPESGGGILISIGSASISNNVISGNSAGYGGGIALYPVDGANKVTVTDNVIDGNLATSGTAVMLVTYYKDSLRLTGNLARGNSAGSLITCDGMPFTVSRRNVLINQTGPELGGTCISGR